MSWKCSHYKTLEMLTLDPRKEKNKKERKNQVPKQRPGLHLASGCKEQ
jgi:hypothetical protein